MRPMKALTEQEWRRVYDAAAKAGVKMVTYCQWKHRGAVSQPWARDIARATGISKARLCPRVYA